MKEILAVNANYHATISDGGKMEPSVEIILIASEPSYSFDPSGHCIRSRSVEPFRFASSPKQLRDMSEKLAAIAEQCEREVAEAIAKTIDQKP